MSYASSYEEPSGNSNPESPVAFSVEEEATAFSYDAGLIKVSADGPYISLKEAIAAAESGFTIVVHGNADGIFNGIFIKDGPIVINKSIKIISGKLTDA